MKWFKEIIPYIMIVIVVIFIRTFIITPVVVDGTSMNPTLLNNEILLLKKYDRSFKRFDVVVINYGEDKLIKRIIGLPGEHVKYNDNILYINGKVVEESFIDDNTANYDLNIWGIDKIPEDYYFVMGDNRNNSTDSRIIGLIKKDNIVGTTSFAIFPFNRFGIIK